MVYNVFQVGRTPVAATQGHIVSSRTVSIPMPPQDGYPRDRYPPLFSPIGYHTEQWVTYSYTVYGGAYTLEERASELPPESFPQIYYDPLRPARASLNPPAASGSWASVFSPSLAVFLFMICMGLAARSLSR